MSNPKAEQAEATRRRLVQVARSLFTRRGYAAVGTEEIVRRAKVTRGALYHHYRGKARLFEAVVEDVMRDLHAHLARSAQAGGRDPWRRLRAGIQAFLDACLQPDVQRIALIDAPSVLGWQRWRELDARYGLGLLQQALSAAMEAGTVPAQPVKPLAHLLLGALTEAAMLVARAADTRQARADTDAVLSRLLDGLRRS